VLASFEIHSAPHDAPLVLERLELAAEDGGEGLFRALAANGVPLRPSLSINNGEPLVGGPPRGDADAGAIAGAVLAATAGAALAVGGAAAVVLHVRARRQARLDAEAAAALSLMMKLAAQAAGPHAAQPRRSADGRRRSIDDAAWHRDGGPRHSTGGPRHSADGVCPPGRVYLIAAQLER
jgi:hypothetical protein